jgi:hypothetical protein
VDTPDERNRIMHRGKIISPGRLRRIPQSFSWVDHRLVRDHHIDGHTAEALALYLFMLSVADADGLSWWGDEAVQKRLSLDENWLRTARAELQDADLIAYDRPVCQVLDLGGPCR